MMSLRLKEKNEVVKIGLDMYLTAKRYLFTYDENGEDVKISKKIGELFPEAQGCEVVEVRFRVGYWRKANHIHKWFVENIQNGEDDCKEYYVQREKLQKLLDICKKIKKNGSLAPKLLPTQGGFFFGETDYGDDYFRDINDTIKFLEICIKIPEDYNINYQSSW